MQSYISYLVIFVSVLVYGFGFHSSKITGKYYYVTMYDFHMVELNMNKTFYVEQRGCTYSYATKGKWIAKHDTLYLTQTHYKSLRGNKPFKISKPETEMYLERKDSIISLFVNVRNQIVRGKILTKKMPSPFK